MKRFLNVLPIACLLLLASPAIAGGWLIYRDDSYRGKVVDAETTQPIEGAAVVAIWYIERYGGAGGPVAKLFEAKEAVTNENGEFEIPAISGFHWWPFTTLDKPNLIVFKPGYKSYEEYHYNISNGYIKLEKAKTKDERIKGLPNIGYAEYEGADDITPSRKKIPHIVDMIEKERQNLGLQ